MDSLGFEFQFVIRFLRFLQFFICFSRFFYTFAFRPIVSEVAVCRQAVEFLDVKFY